MMEHGEAGDDEQIDRPRDGPRGPP
jgi:hypothetical protein